MFNTAFTFFFYLLSLMPLQTSISGTYRMITISKNARLSALFIVIALIGVSAKGNIFTTGSQVIADTSDAAVPAYVNCTISHTGERRWLPTYRITEGYITVESREKEKENIAQEIKKLQEICDSKELQIVCDSKDLQICDSVCDAQDLKEACISGCLSRNAQYNSETLPILNLQKICEAIYNAQDLKGACISGCLKSRRETICSNVLPALKIYYELLNDPNFTVKEQKFTEDKSSNQ